MKLKISISKHKSKIKRKERRKTKRKRKKQKMKKVKIPAQKKNKPKTNKNLMLQNYKTLILRKIVCSDCLGTGKLRSKSNFLINKLKTSLSMKFNNI